MMPAGASAEVVHLLAAAALALGFAQLTRRLVFGLDAAAAQSAVVAVAAAWRAYATMSGALWGVALVMLAAGAIGLPLLRRNLDHGAAPPPRAPAAIAAAAGLVVLAILAVLPAQIPGMAPLREDLALALATVLVALLLLATRQAAAGLHALANGVALAAVVLGASPGAAVALLALFGFVAAGLVARPTA